MNQYPSHSQMPEFAKNESNTKPVLFQHPKSEEMRLSRLAVIKANTIEAFIFVFLVAIPCWLAVSFLVAIVSRG